MHNMKNIYIQILDDNSVTVGLSDLWQLSKQELYFLCIYLLKMEKVYQKGENLVCTINCDEIRKLLGIVHTPLVIKFVEDMLYSIVIHVKTSAEPASQELTSNLASAYLYNEDNDRLEFYITANLAQMIRAITMKISCL